MCAFPQKLWSCTNATCQGLQRPMTSEWRHEDVIITSPSAFSPERLTDDDHWRQMSSQAPLLLNKGGTTESTMTDHHGHFRLWQRTIFYLCDWLLFMWLTKESLCSLELTHVTDPGKLFEPGIEYCIIIECRSQESQNSQNNQTFALAHIYQQKTFDSSSILVYLVVPCA